MNINIDINDSLQLENSWRKRIFNNSVLRIRRNKFQIYENIKCFLNFISAIKYIIGSFA